MLAPLAPIVQPRRGVEKSSSSSSLPQSPQVLYQQLSQSAQAGVDEIKRFQGLWRNPEMRRIWERVENGIREEGGLLQTSGVWEVDYAEMLEGLVTEEVGKGEREAREEEEREKERLRDSGCEWRGIVEGFMQKDVSGMRVVPGRNEASVMVMLVKAGMVFQLHTVAGLEDSGDVHVPDWKVESKHSPGKPVTRLENAIVDCLNGRGRRWDLGYLLVCFYHIIILQSVYSNTIQDMISSYAEIKQTPCKKCARMTDSSAQLPSLRKSIAVTSPEGTRSFTFEPYHPGCI